MKKTVPILFLVILFAAAVWYSFVKEPDPVHELTPPLLQSMPADLQQVETQPEETVAQAEPETIPDSLPLLNESDPEISRALAELTGADLLTEYLVKREAISRMVATVDALTSRQVPAQINPIKPAGGKFVTENEAERIFMSAENFARYDGYIALLQNVDSGALAALYQRYYPLFQQAWEENGGQGSFNERLLEVIDHLTQTPDVSGPVYLSKPEAVYLFENPELEAMTAGQKILVRMGSVNAAVVKEKLLELSTELSH